MSKATGNLDLLFENVNAPVKPGLVDKVLTTIRNYATVAEIMRVLGAAVMISAMSVMLLKGWHDGNDINRYLKLLGMTGLLSVGGLGLSYLLKEQKGARMFFGLAQLSVPVNFGILGALIYSAMPEQNIIGIYPDFAKWVVYDLSGMVLVAAGAAAILIPVTLLGFRILHRSSANVFTAVFIGLNGLLLLPFRSSLIVGVILAFSILAPVIVVHFSSRKGHSLLAAPGKFAFALLFIPALLLLTRNLYLYQLDYFLGLVLFASVYGVLRQLAVQATNGPRFRSALDILSTPLALGIALTAAGMSQGHLPGIAWYLIYCTVLSAHMIDFNIRSEGNSRIRSLSLSVIAILIAQALSISIVTDTSVLAIAIHILAGAALTTFGLKTKSRTIMVAGGLITIFALLVGFEDLIVLLFEGNWIALAVSGAFIIIAASIIDRFGASIKFKFTKRVI
jgi:hypothetical protein